MASLKGTETHKNLMRAFAGESQARNRYTFFAEIAKNKDIHSLKKHFYIQQIKSRPMPKPFLNI